MSYKQIKWLILIIPTLTIGIWEYVRHEFLLDYLSMDFGNVLAPVIVFLVTILLLTRLFSIMESNQEELNKARTLHAAMQERERIARELHDGIAQSLFLLNAQIDRIEKTGNSDNLPFEEFKKSVHRTNTYVREAIANLRHPVDPESVPWMQGLKTLIQDLQKETLLDFEVQWDIPDEALSSKEKIELLASIREALLNIHKHADAKYVTIHAHATENGWTCTIADDGQGFEPHVISDNNHYGIKIMKDRCSTMKWQFDMLREGGLTLVKIRKEKPST
ncbi:Sensor histidine kinase LiaS [compost metagenome]